MDVNELKELHDAIWRQIYERQKLTMQMNQENKKPDDTTCQKDLESSLDDKNKQLT